MEKIVYADANVYLAMFLEERSRWVDHCEEAIYFFNRVFDKEFKLGCSKFVVYEVKKILEKKGKLVLVMDDFLDTVRKENQLIWVKQDSSDVDEAKKISEHYQDPLHVILAVKIGCVALVSWDNNGFPEECYNKLHICKPEFLILV